jgi:hypothetical protein
LACLFGCGKAQLFAFSFCGSARLWSKDRIKDCFYLFQLKKKKQCAASVMEQKA